jgi:hypothetical protein
MAAHGMAPYCRERSGSGVLEGLKKLQSERAYQLTTHYGTQKQIYVIIHAIKIKLSLPTPRRHIWGTEVQRHSFLKSAVDGDGQQHAPAALTPIRKPQHPLNRRLSGRSHSGKFWGRGNLWPLATYLEILRILIPRIMHLC